MRGVRAKGQKISEQNCGVLNFPKMQRNIARISALASKMGQIEKIKAFYYIKWYIITNLHGNVPLSFLFNPFALATLFLDYLTFNPM